MSIPGIVVVHHFLYVARVVREVVEILEAVIALYVPAGQQVPNVRHACCEALPDVLGVLMHEGVRPDDTNLHRNGVTAAKTNGNTILLLAACSLVISKLLK